MFHISFYRFVAVEDPVHLREHLLGLTAGLLGTILVAHEGVNGMLAGAGDELDAFEAALQAPDVLGGAFAGMAFTRTLCDVAPFRRRKIKVKAELVPLDVDGIDVPSRRADIAASDVDAAGWCALLRRDDVVVLDNRNSFEFGHGHFVGARNPGTVDFRDFAAFVRAIQTGESPPCTGNDGRWSALLCLAAEESVRQGREVSLNAFVTAKPNTALPAETNVA